MKVRITAKVSLTTSISYNYINYRVKNENLDESIGNQTSLG